MSNTKKVTITMTPEEHDMALEDSKEMFGKEGNISGYIRYLVRTENGKKK